jgi:VanZ family protein
MRWVFTAYTALIVVVSLYPSERAPLQGVDKGAHFAAYALLTLLGLAAFSSGAGKVLAVLFALCLGPMLEIVQGFIATRNTSLADEMANLTGALVGVAVYLLVSRFRSGHSWRSG